MRPMPKLGIKRPFRYTTTDFNSSISMNQTTFLLLTLRQEYIKYNFKELQGQYTGTIYNYPLESI